MTRSSKALLALVAAVLAAAVAAAVAEAGDRPALRLVNTPSVVVQGSAFRPREVVSIVALTPRGEKRVVVRAGRRGGFGVRLGSGIRPCGVPLIVRAVGAGGSRVTFRIPARPCPTSPVRARPHIEVPPPIR
jgi:hypothetical protein